MDQQTLKSAKTFQSLLSWLEIIMHVNFKSTQPSYDGYIVVTFLNAV